MRKATRLLGSIAISAVFLSASPASAQQGTPAYATTFYSNATHTAWVGKLLWVECYGDDTPAYHLIGTTSMHSVDTHVGYCLYGQMMPV